MLACSRATGGLWADDLCSRIAASGPGRRTQFILSVCCFLSVLIYKDCVAGDSLAFARPQIHNPSPDSVRFKDTACSLGKYASAHNPPCHECFTLNYRSAVGFSAWTTAVKSCSPYPLARACRKTLSAASAVAISTPRVFPSSTAYVTSLTIRRIKK